MVVICIGPVCVPVVPLLIILLRPIWNVLPEKMRADLAKFWNTKVRPTFVDPWLNKLPPWAQRLCGKRAKKKETMVEKAAPAASARAGEPTTSVASLKDLKKAHAVQSEEELETVKK